MGEWKEYTLDQVYDFGSGLSKSADQFGFGYGFVSFKDVFYNFFLPDKLSQLVNSTDKERETCSVRAGDVFLTRTSETQEELGMSAVALKDYPDATFNGFTKRLRPKGEIEVVPEFAAYYFRSPLFRRTVTSMSSITTRASLNNTMLSALTIHLPDVAEQDAIGSCLKSLDAKIDLLHRQNKTLEAMAEALFRQWFVEEAEEGWEEGTLREIIDIHDTKRVPLSNLQRAAMQTGKLYPYYGAATIMDQVNDYLFDGEYILLGEDGTVVTEDGYPILQYATGKFWVNNHAHVLTAKPPYTNRYLWTYLKRKNIADIVTGAVQPKISQGNLKALPIVLPPRAVVENICATIAPLYARVDKNIDQTRTLSALRDTLLPKLMSGELRVEAQ